MNIKSEYRKYKISKIINEKCKGTYFDRVSNLKVYKKYNGDDYIFRDSLDEVIFVYHIDTKSLKLDYWKTLDMVDYSKYQGNPFKISNRDIEQFIKFLVEYSYKLEVKNVSFTLNIKQTLDIQLDNYKIVDSF